MSAEQTRRMHSGEERRQALVEAAFRCIGEKGFEGLRLRDVAAEVGIDHSTLHHYFPTKEDLVAGVVEYATRQFWPTMPHEGGPAEKLHYHLAALGALIEERPVLFTVMSELDLRAKRDAVVRAIIDCHEEGWRAALREVLRRGAEEGIWAVGLEESVGIESIISVVKGVSLNPDSAGDVLRQLERLLVRPLPDGGTQRPVRHEGT